MGERCPKPRVARQVKEESGTARPGADFPGGAGSHTASGEGKPALIRIEAQAVRFLKQVVREIVGTVVEVGQAKRSPKTVMEILEARDRRAADMTAPAHGLYLVRVDY